MKDKFDAIFSATRYTKALENIKKFRKEQQQKCITYKAELTHLKTHQDTVRTAYLPTLHNIVFAACVCPFLFFIFIKTKQILQFIPSSILFFSAFPIISLSGQRYARDFGADCAPD